MNFKDGSMNGLNAKNENASGVKMNASKQKPIGERHKSLMTDCEKKTAKELRKKARAH
jgi:hypothetical protein